jgi:hypothetical protein
LLQKFQTKIKIKIKIYIYIYIYNVPNMEVEGCGCNAFLNDSMGISPFMSFIIAWVHSNEQGFSILSTHTTLWEINVYVHVSL